MKVVYCSNCGTRLNVTRKALPKYGTIIDIVEYHKCPDEPVEFDLTPVDVPTFNTQKGKDKFIQKINDLALSRSSSKSELKDRRDEKIVKSTAPQSVLGIIKDMEGTTPAHEFEDLEKGDSND